MSIKNILHGLLLAIFLTVTTLPDVRPASAQAQTPLSVSGWFTILWGDNSTGTNTAGEIYILTTDDGQKTALLLNEKLVAPFGGILALDRQRVTIQGVQTLAPADQAGLAALRVDSISLEYSQEKKGAVGVGAVSGSKPFISIMCKFLDISAEPKNLSYFQGMYSSVFPGLDHYWREVSYNTANIAGSNAVGWYTLPQPRSYYVYNNELDKDRAAKDCTRVADAAVNFTNFTGINLMFNSDLDGYAWGGGWVLTLDGATKAWPITWEPPWGYGSIAVIAHEMGHAFGMPHSSGNYGQTYDNQWDVMSDTWTGCSRSTDPTYGCLGQHTIAYHKDRLGWIPAGQKNVVAWNTWNTLTLEQLGLPTNASYKLVQVPIGGSSTHFYTLEVRRQTGYDFKLPGQAVIIHEVDTTRGRPANVIDIDGNGNTGDAGAMWTVGETFSDAINNLSITVDSAAATGFQVTIHNNSFSIFADVPLAYWANTSIENLYNAGVTGGCMTVPLSYCPTSPVTRAQMAVFLLRGMHGSTYTPPAATGTKFTDVPLGTFGAAWIEQLAVEGITSGCGGGNYCPTTPVSRAQMAVFLVRAKHGSTFVPPTATGIFLDVPIGSFGADYIEQLSADAITSGCGSGNFCPNTTVKRDSMAVFLVKTFNLP